MYLNLLENVIDFLIIESLENEINHGNLLLDEGNLLFQHDGLNIPWHFLGEASKDSSP